jgi:Holliday junction resolvase RusA-like endonuclease
MTLTLTPPCDFINANDRLHHHPKARLTWGWRNAARLEIEKWPFRQRVRLRRAHITVAIRFSNNIRRDVGNYYPTAKAIVDGLVDAHLIEDDNDLVVIGPDMRREYPNGPARATVTIEEIPCST